MTKNRLIFILCSKNYKNKIVHILQKSFLYYYINKSHHKFLGTISLIISWTKVLRMKRKRNEGNCVWTWMVNSLLEYRGAFMAKFAFIIYRRIRKTKAPFKQEDRKSCFEWNEKGLLLGTITLLENMGSTTSSVNIMFFWFLRIWMFIFIWIVFYNLRELVIWILWWLSCLSKEKFWMIRHS